MRIHDVFVSIEARDFARMSAWWEALLERPWDREPMPSCREWDLAGGVLFQVHDHGEGAGVATVTLRIDDLDRHAQRLRAAGVPVPGPVRIEGFATLRFCGFQDPEGNAVGLLEGS